MASKDLNIRLKIRAQADQAKRQIDAAAASIEGLGDSAEDASLRISRLTAGAFSFNEIADAAERLTDIAGSIIRLSDSYVALETRIGNAIGSQEQAALIMERLGQVAQDTHQPLEETAELYARVAEATKGTAVAQERLVDFSKAVNLAMRVSKTSAQEASGALGQLSQSLASGVFRGEEFNSVSEQMPAIMDALASSLGVARGELREMAAAGELTADKVMDAVLSMSDEWEAAAANMPIALSDALTDLESAWQEYLGQSETVTGASQAIASSISLVTDNLTELLDAAQAGALAALPAILLKTTQVLGGYIQQARNAAQAQREQTAASKAAVQAQRESAAADLAAAQAKIHVALVSREATRAELARAQAQEAEALQARKNAQQVALYGQQRAAIERQVTAATNLRIGAEKRLAAASAGVAAATTASNKASLQAVAANKAVAASTAGVKKSLKGMLNPLNALNLGMAAFTGWEVGKWANREFAIVRKAGVGMVQAVTTAFEYMRTAWESFEAVFTSDTVAAAWDRHQGRAERMAATFKDMYEDAEKAGGEFDNLAGSADISSQSMAGLESSASGAAGAVEKVGAAAASTGAALTDVAGPSEYQNTFFRQLQAELTDLTEKTFPAYIARVANLREADLLAGAHVESLQAQLIQLRQSWASAGQGPEQYEESVKDALANVERVVVDGVTTFRDGGAAILEAAKGASEGVGQLGQSMEGVANSVKGAESASRSWLQTSAELERSYNDGAISLEEYRQRGQELTQQFLDQEQAANAAADGIQEVADSAEGAGDGVEGVGESVEAGNVAMTGAVSLTHVIAQRYAELGTAAEEFFWRQMSAVDSIKEWWTVLSDAEFEKAKARFEDYERETLSLVSALDEGTATATQFQAALQLADGSLDILKDGVANKFRSAVAGVRKDLEALTETVDNQLRRVQDRIDRAEGNEAAILEREQQEELAELEESRRQAQRAGDIELLAKIDKLSAAQEKAHTIEMRSLQERLAGEKAINDERRAGLELQPGASNTTGPTTAAPAGVSPGAAGNSAAPATFDRDFADKVAEGLAEAVRRFGGGQSTQQTTVRIESGGGAVELSGDDDSTSKLIQILEGASLSASEIS